MNQAHSETLTTVPGSSRIPPGLVDAPPAPASLLAETASQWAAAACDQPEATLTGTASRLPQTPCPSAHWFHGMKT